MYYILPIYLVQAKYISKLSGHETLNVIPYKQQLIIKTKKRWTGKFTK